VYQPTKGELEALARALSKQRSGAAASLREGPDATLTVGIVKVNGAVSGLSSPISGLGNPNGQRTTGWRRAQDGGLPATSSPSVIYRGLPSLCQQWQQ